MLRVAQLKSEDLLSQPGGEKKFLTDTGWNLKASKALWWLRQHLKGEFGPNNDSPP